MICLLLFFERLLEELGRVGVAKTLGKRSGRAIGSDFVVLNTLGCGDEGRIENIGVAIGAENYIAFFDEPDHRAARFTIGFDAAMFEDRLQALNVFLGLTQMILERLF